MTADRVTPEVVHADADEHAGPLPCVGPVHPIPACAWCNGTLAGGEVVHDPLNDDGCHCGGEPALLHFACAEDRKRRHAEYEHHASRGTPIGGALVALETLVELLDGGDAVVLMPQGSQANQLRRIVRKAKGLCR